MHELVEWLRQHTKASALVLYRTSPWPSPNCLDLQSGPDQLFESSVFKRFQEIAEQCALNPHSQNGTTQCGLALKYKWYMLPKLNKIARRLFQSAGFGVLEVERIVGRRIDWH